MVEIDVQALKERLDRGEKIHLLDVREDEEVRICSLPGAEHIPMVYLFAGLREPSAPREAEVVVFCHHGLRSLDAARFLRMQGFQKVRSLAGGIDAWAEVHDPAMTRY